MNEIQALDNIHDKLSFLKDQVVSANSHLHLANLIAKHQKTLFKFSNTFFLLSYYSHLQTAILHLSKMIEERQNNQSLTIHKFLNVVEHNSKHIGPKSRPLIKLHRANLLENQDLFKRIINFRDKSLAHNDLKYLNNEKAIKEANISRNEIKKMINFISKILSEYYSVFYDAEQKFDLLNIDDFEFLVEILKNYKK